MGWSKNGEFILLNTRPFVGSASHGSRATQTQHATLAEMFRNPTPDLSTSVELLVLNSSTLDCVGLFDGHFAFTTKESPFLLFTDEWRDSDFLASGGEDHQVYVWHRRHRRMLRRLHGHSEAVNAVSWNGFGYLASASDDNTVVIWTNGQILR